MRGAQVRVGSRLVLPAVPDDCEHDAIDAQFIEVADCESLSNGDKLISYASHYDEPEETLIRARMDYETW